MHPIKQSADTHSAEEAQEPTSFLFATVEGVALDPTSRPVPLCEAVIVAEREQAEAVAVADAGVETAVHAVAEEEASLDTFFSDKE